MLVSSSFLDSVEGMFLVLAIPGEPSIYDLVFVISSNSSKLLVTTDLGIGLEVKTFAWSVGTLSLPLIGVAGLTASVDIGCGDGKTKPMLIFPTCLTAAILKDGTAKSYYKKI